MRKWLALGLLILAGTPAFAAVKVFRTRGAKTVDICISETGGGCEYATLQAACAAVTSTAAHPVTFHIHAGLYAATDTMCSGQDHASFIGDGIGVTILQGLDHGFGDDLTHYDCSAFTSPSPCKGALNLGNSTNITISGISFKGSRGVWWQGNGTGGVTGYIHDNYFETTTQNLDEDCFFINNMASGTRILYDNNHCNSWGDGFTLNNSANVFITAHGNEWRNPSGVLLQIGAAWAFRAVPCLFDSSGDTINYNGARPAGGHAGFMGYQFTAEQAPNSCISGAIIRITAPQIDITNTSPNGSTSSATGIEITSTTAGISTFDVIGPRIRVSASDTTTGVSIGINSKSTSVNPNIVGGYIRHIGGLPASSGDIVTAADGSIPTYVTGVDFSGDNVGSAINSIIAGDQRYLTVGKYASLPARTVITRASGASTPAINVTSGNLEGGLLIDNLNSGTDTSPWLKFCNGTASDNCWRQYINGNTTHPAMILEDVSTERLHVRDDDFQYTGAANANWRFNNTGGYLFLGTGANDDNLGIRFQATNNGDIAWSNTTKTMNLNGVDKLKIGAGSDLAVGSCTIGSIALDTGGATKEWCVCGTANVWGCWNLTTGTFNANGPAD
jgi:hypothetical protein